MSYLNSKLDKNQPTYNWPVIIAFTFFLTAVVLFAFAKLLKTTSEIRSHASTEVSIQTPLKTSSALTTKHTEHVLPTVVDDTNSIVQPKEKTKQSTQIKPVKPANSSISPAHKDVVIKTTVKEEKQMSMVSDEMPSVSQSEPVTSQPATKITPIEEPEKAGFFCSSSDHDAGLCE